MNPDSVWIERGECHLIEGRAAEDMRVSGESPAKQKIVCR